MAAVTNGSGKNRVAPVVKTSGAGAVSIDDDKSKTPDVIVGFTTQAMIVANTAGVQGTALGVSLPQNMIV